MKLYIAVGTAVLLVMAIFIIVFVAYYQQKQIRQQLAIKEIQEKHRKALMVAAHQAQEQERRRIAQDLHDEIGTMLSVTKMSLTHIDRAAESFAPNTSALVMKTRSLLDETISNVRRISRDLVPTTLERFGLSAALEELAEKAGQGDIRVDLSCPEQIGGLPPHITLMLYRIAQELINNAIKHAHARHIDIALQFVNNEWELVVTDDGRGFDLDEILRDKRRGLGLRNIESRVSAVDGHVLFDVAKGRGSRVVVRVSPQPEPEPQLALRV